MKILITGASGQVGRALLATTPPATSALPLSHHDLDISDAAAVAAAIEHARPDVIINAAAYTAVDAAESHAEQAHAVNALGPMHLARVAAHLGGCRLLHVSTDYVFDGSAAEPYRPADPPHPLSVYGRTKLQGEQSVLELLPASAAVLRTAWVYAAQGRNFVLTMLRLMREQGALRVVSDQRGSPTAAQSVAAALWRLAERPDCTGLFHWTDAGTVSWYEFARAIAEEALAAGLLRARPEITAISTAEYPTAARRPANSALNSEESQRRLGLQQTPWRTSLAAVIREVADRDQSAAI